jgi:Icc-related predicted phosphoesterase
MRVHVLSDIHFEHMQKQEGDSFFRQLEEAQKKDPADLVILAGDICQIGRHESFWKARVAQLISGYKKALYVPGNHEYYNYSFLDGDRFFEDVDHDPNFHNFIQLDHGPFEFGGIRFVGNTMWFPDSGTPYYVKRGMSDFHAIGTGASPFEPLVYERHQDFVKKVMGNLRTGDVVVTHHLPLPACVDPQYAGSSLNPFFMADMSAHLHEDRLPRAWVFGHTHTPVDTFHQVGTEKMRLYCNPHGYPHEGANSRFWDRIGVDL